MTSGMGYPQPPTTITGDGTDGQGTMGAAKEQAADLGHTAMETGGQVASTVAEQARTVAGETTRQAKDLMNEAHAQLKDQAGAQKEKATAGLHSLADGLRSMAEGNAPQAGVATDLAKEAADKAKQIATWLESRDPGTLLNDVRALARRRPGAFLLGAALAGVAAGRLTRGAIAAGSADSSSSGPATLASTSNGYGRQSSATMLGSTPALPRQDLYGQDHYRAADTAYADAGATPYTTPAPAPYTTEPDYGTAGAYDDLSTPGTATTRDGGR